ncbi:MAG: alpha/beta fold hydrolase [Balneolaceae bacterium]|nr:alpha/beta fold hydrolase [Balneolaceae bacterium]
MNFNTQKEHFKSAPWCVNGHVHTVLCSLLFPSPTLHYQRVVIDTPDDDFLELDVSEKGKDAPVAVLLHGLEGHSKRYYVTQLGEQLSARGFTVVSINFRGCGSKMNRQRKFYHSGETEDLHTIYKWVESEYPNSPIVSAGFSLGGSALLNYLKAHGTNHPVKAAATISTPFELEKGSHNLEKGFNKLYSIRFLRTLQKKLEEKREQFPDLPQFTGSTLYEFDDQVTAPIHGFESADDYYHQCASYYFMDKIKTNTLVVHSKEDPMCPFEWTPIDVIHKNPFTEPCFTEKGGHVGFWSLPPGWLNKTVAEYFKSFV